MSRPVVSSPPWRRAQLFQELLERLTSDVDWSQVDYVVGSHEDVLFSGISHPCSFCSEAVYTGRASQFYPEGLAYLCDDCCTKLPVEDAAN